MAESQVAPAQQGSPLAPQSRQKLVGSQIRPVGQVLPAQQIRSLPPQVRHTAPGSHAAVTTQRVPSQQGSPSSPQSSHVPALHPSVPLQVAPAQHG